MSCQPLFIFQFLLIFFFNANQAAFTIGGPEASLAFARDIILDYQTIYELFDPQADTPVLDSNQPILEATKRLKESFEIIPDLREDISKNEKFLLVIEHDNWIRQTFDQFVAHVTRVQVRDEDFVNYAKWLVEITNKEDGFAPRLKAIHAAMLKPHENFASVYHALTDSLKNITWTCDSSVAPQQQVYQIYYHFVLANEVKALVMSEFAYGLLEIVTKKNYLQHIDLLEQDYLQRLSKTHLQVQNAVSSLSRLFLVCEPSEEKKDITYTTIAPVFQRYIRSRYGRIGLGSEKPTVEEDITWESQVCTKFQKDDRCSGRTQQCTRIVYSKLGVCMAEKSSGKRYEYLRLGTSKPKYIGKHGECKTKEVELVNYLGTGVIGCAYTLCVCHDIADDVDRHFNLRPVTSDVVNNKVITGVRITKDRNLFHIQIKQAELSHGFVNATSVAWKPLETFSPLDASIEKGVDIFTVEWDRRTVCLDDLDAVAAGKPNHVLTGLRFAQPEKGPGLPVGYLRLEVQLTPYNQETGRLSAEESVWIGNDKPSYIRIQEPYQSYKDDKSNYKTNMCITISKTNDEFDFGQSTAPLIDIQDVIVSQPIVPLSGAGLYYKQGGDYGGYFALRLFTHNVA